VCVSAQFLPVLPQAVIPYKFQKGMTLMTAFTTNDKIREALRFVDASERETWLKMGMAVKSELGENGFDLWDAWSQGADSYRERDARDVWRSIDPSGGIGLGTLFYEAKQSGWRDSHPAPIDPVKQAQRQAQRKADQAKAQAQKATAHEAAQAKAKEEWASAHAADPNHPYLVAKGTRPHNLRQSGEMLLVPLYDQTGALWSLQTISPDGGKRFLSGSKAAGMFCPIGDFSKVQTLLICEGWATGATLHEATGQPVLCAMNDGNLKAVAMAAKAKWPDAELVICADNDRHTKGNPGLTKATDAAKAVGAKLAVPQFPEGVPGSDFNDLVALYRQGGL
jgi:putative DNA primase/helicase